MTDNFQAQLDECREQAYNGTDTDDIRRLIRSWEVNAEDERLLVMATEEYAAQLAVHKEARHNAVNQILLGLTLIGIGFGLSYFTYSLKASEFILVYGPILGGAWILKEGYKNYRIPVENRPVPTVRKRNKFDRF